ncbi:MAG: hypothetical protein K0U38_01490 [Epsilonproteobacteria bacterium]|nr:hypothetical protein [Campylobacterota bacterium]
MNDNPTVDEAFEAASAELTSTEETPKEEVETPSPSPEESESKDESEEKPSESPEEDTKDESKEEEVDFLKVEGDTSKMTPDELMEVKKNWERAYTAKRQSEREELAELKRQLAEKEEQTPAQAEEMKPLEQMTQQEYAQYVADMAKAEVRVAEDNAYIEAQEKSFYEADPRLNQDNPEFNEDLHDLVSMRLSNEREQHESEGNPVKSFDFIGRTKELIGAYDKNIKVIKQHYLQNQSKIARTKANDFAKDTPKTSGAKTKQKTMNLDEALEAAMG